MNDDYDVHDEVGNNDDRNYINYDDGDDENYNAYDNIVMMMIIDHLSKIKLLFFLHISCVLTTLFEHS